MLEIPNETPDQLRGAAGADDSTKVTGVVQTNLRTLCLSKTTHYLVRGLPFPP